MSPRRMELVIITLYTVSYKQPLLHITYILTSQVPHRKRQCAGQVEEEALKTQLELDGRYYMAVESVLDFFRPGYTDRI